METTAENTLFVETARSEPLGLALSTGLDEVEARMIHLAVGHRLDRLGSMVQEHLGAGGSRTRARLALAAADALGLRRERVLSWAAACELVHNATLVHDDLQDGDRVRRGRPSLWARHGAAQAINAGDLLLMLPFRAVESVEVDDAIRFRLMRAVAKACEETVRGQSSEMTLLGGRKLDWSSWEAVAAGKSGALLALPIEGAALIARLSPTSAAALAAPFATIGVLYQVYDDVLDLWGDKGRDRRGNDVREGKPSAVVAAHLELHPVDEQALVAVLEKPREETTDDDVAHWVRRFQEGGALGRLRQKIEALETRILRDPSLSAVPDLAGIARDLVSQLRSTAPTALGVRS